MSCDIRWWAATRSSRSESRCGSCAGSGGAAELLFERDERELEGVGGIGVRDDVVTGFDHRDLVGGQRSAGGPLRELSAHPRERARYVQQLAPLAEHLGDRLVELVPRHDVRAADLERPIRSLWLV